jgi:hypothetical protein
MAGPFSPPNPPPGVRWSAPTPPQLPAAPPPYAPKSGLSVLWIVVIVVVVLVAISVVTSAVLYVLVSGLTRTEASTPYLLGMSVSSDAGPLGTPTSYYVNLSLDPVPSTGFSTAIFGLQLLNSTNSAQSLVGASSGCVWGASSPATDCVAGGTGWYAVLVGPTGSVAATYSLSAGRGVWGNFAGSSTSVELNNDYTLTIVSDASYAGGGFSLAAFSTGSESVAGSVHL